MSAPRPAVSVVIPTLNEGAGLEDCVERLRASASRDEVEIVVCDGGSADGTTAAARRLADRLVEAGGGGRANQMHRGALAANGELLLFLHADTRLPDGWLGLLRAAWSRAPRPGATAFRLGFDRDEPVYRLIAALGNLRSRWTGVPQGDQAVACRREEYLRVGGFPPVPLLEEYFLLPKLAALGPVVTLDARVATSARRYERNGPVFNALRNSLIVALFRLGVPPETLKRLYT
ncbi:MAG: TIGR04283 family arsenosugar biosynthesis glycosyltransferase [Elusimicrobia bacterium]|nr:TIGR04283 family arsenosugar biosynthesis glycosyltransferase [Elusimicrobiota bacterium]